MNKFNKSQLKSVENADKLIECVEFRLCDVAESCIDWNLYIREICCNWKVA